MSSCGSLNCRFPEFTVEILFLFSLEPSVVSGNILSVTY